VNTQPIRLKAATVNYEEWREQKYEVTPAGLLLLAGASNYSGLDKSCSHKNL